LTLADYLRMEGFFTTAFTGGGYVQGKYGFSKGFDSFHLRGKTTAPDSAESLAGHVLAWLEQHRDRNFFLFLHTYQIHNPFFPPEEYADQFLSRNSFTKCIDMIPGKFYQENRFSPQSPEFRQNIIDLYDAEIRYTDETLIAPLLRRLKELNLYDDTMIIITSDHGEEFYDHGAWLHMHSLYNELIRIPLIIKFFGNRFKSEKIDKISRITDIMPTILGELGITKKKKSRDGKSLIALLKGKEKGLRQFVSELASNTAHNRIPRKTVINLGERKFISNELYSADGLGYFVHHPENQDRWEIYDLTSDLRELINKAPDYPGDLRRIARIIESLLKRYEGKSAAQKAELDEDLRRELKALGYIK